MSTRIETKWEAKSEKLPEIAGMISREGYAPIYPARRIFSVYYDGSRYPEYWRGEEGIVPRIKRRIRWYHDQDGYRNGATYEVKISGEEGRVKYSGKTGQSMLSYAEEIRKMLELIRSRQLVPVSLVTYVRRYFGSPEGRRFTVDHDITYRRVFSFDLSNLRLGSAARDDMLALELKAETTLSNGVFCESMPMTRIRFSKFARSLEHLCIV